MNINHAREMADTRALESRRPGHSDTEIKVAADDLQRDATWVEALDLHDRDELLARIEQAMSRVDAHAGVYRLVRLAIEDVAERVLCEADQRDMWGG